MKKFDTENILVDCSNCNIKVKGIFIGEYDVINENDLFDSVKYLFVKCPVCNKPLLLESDTIYEFGELDWGIPQKIFPLDEFHINPEIPKELSHNLNEGIKCYKVSSFNATVLMCRKVLDIFCILKNVNENTLQLSLLKLKEQKIINEQLYEWADNLRLVGNKAAHSIDTNFTAQDAKDILDFTVAILDFTYSFKEKFEMFKQRNNK